MERVILKTLIQELDSLYGNIQLIKVKSVKDKRTGEYRMALSKVQDEIRDRIYYFNQQL